MTGQSTVTQLLTLAELAQLLHVHKRTIPRMLKRGEIPEPIRLGKGKRPLLRWDQKTIEQFMEEQSGARKQA